MPVIIRVVKTSMSFLIISKNTRCCSESCTYAKRHMKDKLGQPKFMQQSSIVCEWKLFINTVDGLILCTKLTTIVQKSNPSQNNGSHGRRTCTHKQTAWACKAGSTRYTKTAHADNDRDNQVQNRVVAVNLVPSGFRLLYVFVSDINATTLIVATHSKIESATLKLFSIIC